MPRPSNTDERRAQIADALKRVMARKGYDGATVNDIAAEADLTPGLVHYHFRNKLEILLTEIVKIEADIDLLRQEVQSGMMRPGDSATRISHLSKELRGHVVEADRIQVARDRRGLIMAGADKVMRELKSIFKGNEEMTNALELAYESVWSDIANEA